MDYYLATIEQILRNEKIFYPAYDPRRDKTWESKLALVLVWLKFVVLLIEFASDAKNGSPSLQCVLYGISSHWRDVIWLSWGIYQQH